MNIEKVINICGVVGVVCFIVIMIVGLVVGSVVCGVGFIVCLICVGLIKGGLNVCLR